jgi:hypothetical protein
MANLLNFSIPSARLDARIQTTALVMPFEFGDSTDFRITASTPFFMFPAENPETSTANTIVTTANTGTGNMLLVSTGQFNFDVMTGILEQDFVINAGARVLGTNPNAPIFRSVITVTIRFDRMAGTITFTPKGVTDTGSFTYPNWHRMICLLIEATP